MFLTLLLANTLLGQDTVVRGRVVGITDGDTINAFSFLFAMQLTV